MALRKYTEVHRKVPTSVLRSVYTDAQGSTAKESTKFYLRLSVAPACTKEHPKSR